MAAANGVHQTTWIASSVRAPPRFRAKNSKSLSLQANQSNRTISMKIIELKIIGKSFIRFTGYGEHYTRLPEGSNDNLSTSPEN